MKESLKQISNLIERFERNIEAYRSPAYNETQLRREFIDPFFEALGWDVANKAGYAEQYKDVVHEDAIKVSGATKAPDYCFRMGGVRKFFLETKKPSVDIKEQTSPAYQLRRYAWSAKLPISILTDFEALAIYDCRLRPKPSDKPSIGRVRFYTYDRYLDSFEEIYNLLSKESVLKGSFDKFAESERQKRGTTEVDAEFLKEIESWRETLAKEIAIRNPKLSVKELNFAVQLTIDRIIFLRMCEDRGIEKYGQIQSLLNGANTYHRLREIFYHADDKYNSGLFDFKTDRLTPELKLDDKPLKDIFKNLYYPESPYEFSVLGADILGHVYEQFLGKVIRLTEGHRAKVEEKPEVRKAGGVYYTPTYIVDYIVKNTVGKIVGAGLSARRVGAVLCDRLLSLSKDQGTHREAPLQHKLTPKQISSLRILDPACGSGSFLLGAYQYLLDYHLNWYLAHHSKKGNVAQGFSPAPKEMYRGRGGQWYLTIQEKKRILLNNIYGVDIDPQAVEVTKLSLLLKVLEGENQDTLERQMKLFKERALPDLGSNIKCGNSLIGPDFYQGKQMNFLDSEETYRINPFDWQKEFPEIMKGGGFDTVIGNPPYVRQEMLGTLKDYFQEYYTVYHGVSDLYVYFIERGVSLLKKGGIFSYIVANKWMRANYGEPLRRWMKKQKIEEIVDFGDLPVFQKATTYPCILRLRRDPPSAIFHTAQIKTLAFVNLEDYVHEHTSPIKQATLNDGGWTISDEGTQALLNKIRAVGVPLGEYVKGRIFRGILTGLNEAFVIDAEMRNKLIRSDPKSVEIIKPFLAGRDIKRYQSPRSNQFLIFTRHGINIKEYPAIERHLLDFKAKLMPKPKNWRGTGWKGRKPGTYQWHEIQDTIDYYVEFEKSKIIYPNICKRPEFTFDKAGIYTNQKCFIISLPDMYLLGLLNSKVIFFLFQSILPKLRGGFYEPSYVYFKDFPIRPINFSDRMDKARHDKMVELVEQMLTLHKQLVATKTPDDKIRLQRQINATDHQIDHLVCELYGLTVEEIKIIEEGAK
ncbi:MAG: restriction endonuclease subunit R [Deltaproteobacteria bacterium RBG_16_49_23]|nr:MAG: restriction endonuclease subunit R [Deltaproteobacteria bacterium RBG_16_49_23]